MKQLQLFGLWLAKTVLGVAFSCLVFGAVAYFAGWDPMAGVWNALILNGIFFAVCVMIKIAEFLDLKKKKMEGKDNETRNR